MFLLPLAPPRKPRPLVEGPFVKYQAVVSPDGRWLAYVSNESGQLGVYVRPFPSGEGRYQVSDAPAPSRAGAGTAASCSTGRATCSSASRSRPGATFRAGKPEALFDRVATGRARRAPTRRRPTASASSPSARPGGVGSRTAIALDLGFARRLSKGRRPATRPSQRHSSMTKTRATAVAPRLRR